MPILNIQLAPAGLIGVVPGIVYINTNDTVAQVTTTGYLNQAVQSGFALSNGQMALVTTQTSSTASPDVGFLEVSKVGANYSLIPDATPGDVVLPTIANHIATFTNTTGTLSEDPATAISGGNIQAGLSGTAGFVKSFPTTAANGSLILQAINAGANFTTTIRNSTMGQNSIFSMPDPGVANSNFCVIPTALVSGNLTQASGTLGLIVDSGITGASVSSAITQLGQLQQISVTLNTAAVIAAFATPQVLIPAAAGKVAIVHSANVYTASTGNTPFATGTAPIIQYGTTVHGAGTIATGSGFVTGDITAAASQVRTLNQAATAVYTGITNTAVTFSCATAYTAGTGTSVTFTLVYELITATV